MGKVTGLFFNIIYLTLKLMLVSFSEMLDGCRALLAIANVTTPYVFDGLLKSMRLL